MRQKTANRIGLFPQNRNRTYTDGGPLYELTSGMEFKKWEKGPVERLHTQFYKYFLGLNKRAPNVVARNETGRLPLKLNI